MELTPIKEFLTDIALDPARLAAYVMDPERAMAAAGLGADDKAVLQNADQRAIHARVSGRNEADLMFPFEMMHDRCGVFPIE